MYRLVLSSNLFLANSFVAYKNNERIVSLLLLLVYVCSTLHHSTHINNSYCHKLDLFMSRSTTFLLFPYSLKFSRPSFCFMAINNMILSYGLSHCIDIIYDNTSWVWCHMYFHVLTNVYIYTSLKDCKRHKQTNYINYPCSN